MEFRILGPIEAARKGDRVALSGTKAQTVLAALLLARGRVVSDGQLSYLLWGWRPPATMNAQIYTYISRLRKRLGPSVALLRQPPGYLIRTNDAWVDIVEFERLDAQGRHARTEGRFEEAAALLRTALDLWRGTALANGTEFLAEVEQPRLEEAWAATLEHRIEADLAMRQHNDLVPELAGLVARFPVREKLRAQFMTALWRSNRQADALETYQQGRRILAEELGVDPGQELARTYHAALDGTLELPAEARTLAAQGAQPATVPPAPTTLPPAVVDVIGRSALLADIRTRLTGAGSLPDGASEQPNPSSPHAGHRPYTAPRPGHHRAVWGGPTTLDAPARPRRVLLTGMPGSGKTVLAVSAAASVAAHFPDGQLYAELSRPDGTPCDPRQILVRLLGALGDPDDTGTANVDDLLYRYRLRTAGRRLLVVLDGAVGDRQIQQLVPPTGPEAGLILTARRPLAMVAPAETLHVGELPHAEALAMLGAVVGSGRTAAESDAAEAITRYCAGLPLALRIAGARLAARPAWPLAHLARRLAPRTTRLQELRYGDLDLPHAFASCLPPLALDEPARLARLAEVSHGPFRAGTGARVLDLPERRAEALLEELVDAGLLETAGVDRKSRLLYRFHPLGRAFALTLSDKGAGSPHIQILAS
ncbi:NB-ARC domain-containing protein (plasmid) [Streptomyces sp. NBC_00440]|uniref:AfsR/SARP family transcriptional regulator n=1 Tax=unclassified Streptomyces TaxID=2593676 RepID=UPI002E1C9565|nr:NB-ARC domain-containing protein [Streptomyces sp. NBC_00963]